MLKGSFTKLKTNRLHLMRFTKEDAPAIFAMRSNKENNRYVDRPADSSLKDSHAFIS